MTVTLFMNIKKTYLIASQMRNLTTITLRIPQLGSSTLAVSSRSKTRACSLRLIRHNFKMQVKLKLIAAACENMGIGVNGDLPWRLRKEMDFFTKMTSTTKDGSKKNVVLMGRRTWESIPKKFKPLANRINVVLTSQPLDLGDDAIVCKNLPEAVEKISSSPLKDKVEQVWVIGGSSVYKAAMDSPNFFRLYLTRVKKHFDCDTFFPQIPKDYVSVKDPQVPQGIQEEKDIQFEYQVYEKI